MPSPGPLGFTWQPLGRPLGAFGGAPGESYACPRGVLERLGRVLAAAWTRLGKNNKKERGAYLNGSVLATQNGFQNLEQTVLKNIMFSDASSNAMFNEFWSIC